MSGFQRTNHDRQLITTGSCSEAASSGQGCFGFAIAGASVSLITDVDVAGTVRWIRAEHRQLDKFHLG
jgi:hypothetical protein